MPLVSVTTDPEELTMTLVGEYPVPVERLWEAWVDPRQIERFWGPPGWPATFTRHDMVPGGESHYFMRGPDGEHSAGFWHMTAVDPGRRFAMVDGFSGSDGQPNDEMPHMQMDVRFEPIDGGSRFVYTTRFPDESAMEQLIGMGMLEGSKAAMAQMQPVLDDLAAFVAGRATDLEVLDETRVRVLRLIRGTAEAVWRAHRDADIMRRWLLGPDGWSMPVCVLGRAVGDRERLEWESEDGQHRFGFEGEILELVPDRRMVTTERPIDSDVQPNINELTLTPVSAGTILSLVITCPSVEVRDEMLATGMVEGMEASYARLESLDS